MSKYARGMEVDDLARQLEAEREREERPHWRSPGKATHSGHAVSEPAEAVIARLRRSRVVPWALRVPCTEHDAAPDEPCFGDRRLSVLGVCMARVSRGRVAHRAAQRGGA